MSRLKKDPIYSIINEQVVVSSMLINERYNLIVKNSINEDMLFNDKYKRIFKLILKTDATDLVNFTSSLSEDEINSVGGYSSIAELVNAIVGNEEQLNECITKMQNYYRIRQAKDILSSQYHAISLDSDDFIAETRYLLSKVPKVSTERRITRFSDDYSLFDKRINDYLEGNQIFFKTGIEHLDTHLHGGIHPRGLYIIAARTHMGKTDFAVEIALGLLINGYKVRYDTLELSKLELYEIMLSKILRRSRGHLKAGLIARDKVIEAKEQIKMYAKELICCDTPYKTSDLDLWLKDHREELEVLIIDQASFVKLEDSKDKKNERIGNMVNDLLQLTKKYTLPIILLHQINREAEGSKGAKPENHNLKDSGVFEESADFIILLNRKKQPDGKYSNITTAYVSKDRLSDGAGRTYHFEYDNFQYKSIKIGGI